MKDHENYEKSHVFEDQNLPGHRLDFENVEIVEHADTIKKLELKEMNSKIFAKSNPQINNLNLNFSH